jgi:ribonuclease P protein component
LERRYRLRGRTRFLEIRQRGRRWVHPLLVVGVLSNHLDLTRFGFVVSRKLGKAVERNRIRRCLRELVRTRYRNIAPGWDVVLIARPPIRHASFEEIGEAVEDLLRKAGLWQPQEDQIHA